MNQTINYSWESEVRDSEIDIEGIVNNSNYFIYMEHARHKHLKTLEIDFAKLHAIGYNLLLVNTEMAFKDSLRSGDEFIVTSRVEPNGRIRFNFIQEVIRKADAKVVTTAVNTATCVAVATGRPTIPDILKTALGFDQWATKNMN
jgi:acyl-CoA thioester hydrolase